MPKVGAAVYRNTNLKESLYISPLPRRSVLSRHRVAVSIVIRSKLSGGDRGIVKPLPTLLSTSWKRVSADGHAYRSLG